MQVCICVIFYTVKLPLLWNDILNNELKMEITTWNVELFQSTARIQAIH